MARPITFLSDYGLADEFVGVVHAVIAHECPTARVIDLSHGVPRQSVLAGALMLARALPYAPPGVHLAVVDPEVGARRRAVALRTALDDRLLVGPDNGLLLLAADRFGWVTEAVEISHSPWRLEPVSATFHGRDLFAPVAARLAAGEALADAGTPLDPDELVRIELPKPRKGKQGRLTAHVMVIDGFGNVQLDARPGDLADRAHRPSGGDRREGPQRALPAHVRRRRAGRAAALRGRRRDARAGRQRRRGGGGAGRRRTRRRGPPRPVVSALGRPRLHLREIDSTNRRARELAAAGAPHGTLVTAGAQTAGRGRQGRRWDAPAGSALLCSLVCATSTRCCRCAPGWRWPTSPGEPARVKWPNDVLVDGRKVAGVLVEGRPQDGWAVVGIGVNVDARRPRACRARGRWGATDVEEVLAELLGALERRLGEPAAATLTALRERDALLGARCRGRRRERRDRPDVGWRADRRRRRAALRGASER